MKKPIAPCYKCEERKVGCHANCERYLTYAGLNSLKRDERLANSEKNFHTHTKFSHTKIRRMNNGSKS